MKNVINNLRLKLIETRRKAILHKKLIQDYRFKREVFSNGNPEIEANAKNYFRLYKAYLFERELYWMAKTYLSPRVKVLQQKINQIRNDLKTLYLGRGLFDQIDYKALLNFLNQLENQFIIFKAGEQIPFVFWFAGKLKKINNNRDFVAYGLFSVETGLLEVRNKLISGKDLVAKFNDKFSI